MGFTINKTIDLSAFGWEGCSLIFESVSYGELAAFRDLQSVESATIEDADRVVKFLETKFVSGTGMSDGKKVELKASDLADLPLEIFVHIQEHLIDVRPDPNS